MKISFYSNKKNIIKFEIETKITCPQNTKNFIDYKYNNELLFKYFIKIIDSKINISIYPIKNLPFLKNVFIGYFLYDYSNKLKASKIDIIFDKNYLNLKDLIHFGFERKNFIYRHYLKNQKNHNFISKSNLQKKYSNLLKSLNFLKELVSEPSNIIFPESFVIKSRKQINSSRVKLKVLDKKKLQQLGLNCLLAVSQGSQRSPRVIEFQNKNSKKNVDILFVGKGVCFDSGGISIKPSAGMEDMKWDMAGAAVTSAIIKYLSNIDTNFSYAGIVGLVENMPSSTAYKPGDIIKSYKGINVEVLNTDAEGRLVLADIITYGCEIYNPKIVIDFATLTGAVMIALGQHYAGMFSNDDKLSQTLYQSGIDTNEKVWRMPLHDDFDKELNSPFVDLKNIGAGRYGGSVTAAQFLQRFVPPKTKWAHLDIAGTSWKNSGDMLNSKGATGFGLTLIADFIDRYFKN